MFSASLAARARDGILMLAISNATALEKSQRLTNSESAGQTVSTKSDTER